MRPATTITNRSPALFVPYAGVAEDVPVVSSVPLAIHDGDVVGSLET
jgi:hypothetical protein